MTRNRANTIGRVTMAVALMGALACFCISCVTAGAEASGARVSDDDFLDTVAYSAFRYFEECVNPEKGLVQDRATNFAEPDRINGAPQYRVASVAATGYYLSAYAVAAECGWVRREEALDRTLKALRYFADGFYNEHGFYYHFVDINSGLRKGNAEVSSIDTALFLGGVIHAKEFFAENQEVQELATRIYERVDWQWMTNGSQFVSMGWMPGRGGTGGTFLQQQWNHFCEGLLIYVLAIGSPTHPVPVESWFAMSRQIGQYGEYVCVSYPVLFTHQYPHIWIDFRDKNDGIVDYFNNSAIATLANRQTCIDTKKKFKTYDENIWGLTACDGPDGYRAYGGKPGGGFSDGTVAPTAAGGSIVFTPDVSIAALRAMKEKYASHLWGRYGFSDAFNVDRDWFATDCIAIDQGTLLLMIENKRREAVWKYTMQNAWIRDGMRKIGFVPGTKTVSMPKPPEMTIPRMAKPMVLDGTLSEWDLSKGISTKTMHRDFGTVADANDYDGKIYLAYDKATLYVGIKVKDDTLIGGQTGPNIYKDDCIEIYTDPAGDGLKWDDPADVQLGIMPNAKEPGLVRSWAWFQKKNAIGRGVAGTWARTPNGYIVEAAISWKTLKMKPKTGDVIRLSVSLHDRDGANEAKLTTYLEDIGGADDTYALGMVALG